MIQSYYDTDLTDAEWQETELLLPRKAVGQAPRSGLT